MISQMLPSRDYLVYCKLDSILHRLLDGLSVSWEINSPVNEIDRLNYPSTYSSAHGGDLKYKAKSVCAFVPRVFLSFLLPEVNFPCKLFLLKQEAFSFSQFHSTTPPPLCDVLCYFIISPVHTCMQNIHTKHKYFW